MILGARKETSNIARLTIKLPFPPLTLPALYILCLPDVLYRISTQMKQSWKGKYVKAGGNQYPVLIMGTTW